MGLLTATRDLVSSAGDLHREEGDVLLQHTKVLSDALRALLSAIG